MDIGDIFPWPPLLKGLYDDPHKIRELFWDVNFKHASFAKPQKNMQNCKSIYKPTIYIFKKLDHETIQSLNYVMGHLNVKLVENLVDIIDLQLCGSLKL